MSSEKAKFTPEEIAEVKTQVDEIASAALKLIVEKVREFYPEEQRQGFLLEARVVNALFGKMFIPLHYKANFTTEKSEAGL